MKEKKAKLKEIYTEFYAPANAGEKELNDKKLLPIKKRITRKDEFIY